MLIEVQQLTQQIKDLKKRRNSLFARIETLKLRGPNKNQHRIEATQQRLIDTQKKLSLLENRLR